MQNKSTFIKTLKELSGGSIHLDGYLPEQIFYQLEDSINESFKVLEKEVNLRFKKYKKIKENERELSEITKSNEFIEKSNEFIEESDKSMDSNTSNSSQEKDFSDENGSDENGSNENGSDENGSNENGSDENGSDEIDRKDSVNSHATNEESNENGSQEADESTISIESELWMDSHSSDVETLNKPASEVSKMLWDNPKKRK